MIIGAIIHAEEIPYEMIAPIRFNYKTIQLLLYQVRNRTREYISPFKLYTLYQKFIL